MELVPTEVLVRAVRSTRAKSQWSRLQSARIRASTRRTIERTHETIETSCRLVLDHSKPDSPADAWENEAGRPVLRLVR